MIEVVLWFHVILWVAIAWLFLGSARSSLFHPLTFYLVFHGTVFVIRPLMVHYLSFDRVWHYIQFHPTEEQLITTIVATSVALVVFAGVSFLAGGRPAASGVLRDISFTTRERRALLGTWLILGPIAVYSAVFTIDGADFAGLGPVQMERIDGAAVFTNTTGYLFDAKNMLLTLSVLTVMVSRYRWWSIALLIAVLGHRAYLGWGRWAIIVLCFVLALAYLWERDARWPNRKTTIWAVVIAPCILALFWLLGLNRDALRDYVAGESGTAVLPGHSWRESLDTHDFANFDFLTYIMAVVPQKTGTYTYGLQHLQLFTDPIPRVLWEAKPIGPPIQLVDLNEHGNFVGLTVSLAGDGWISGGWIGLIITVAVIASLLGWAHQWFWKNHQSRVKGLLYIVAVAVLFQMFRDGGIVSIVKFLLFLVMPVLVWSLLCRRGIARQPAQASG
jgi:hypothetical protein